MYADNWRPDYIVGLTRGGNIPATIISNMLNIPCEAMKVSFRNDDRVDKDFWLSELVQEKNILIVDDINDTGNTLADIKKKFNCFIKNIKFAVLINNKSSLFEVDYYGSEIDKNIDNSWIVFPWENIDGE